MSEDHHTADRLPERGFLKLRQIPSVPVKMPEAYRGLCLNSARCWA